MEKKSKETKNEPQFIIELNILGKIYKAVGNTFEDACKNLKLSWINIRGRGIVTVISGDKKAEKMFNASQIRRLVYNSLAQRIWARNFELLLK